MVTFTSMVYTLFKSDFVLRPLRFFPVYGHANTKNPLFAKQLCFNVNVAGSATFIFVLFL